LIELRCVLDAATAHDRIARRAASGGGPSDADANVAELMAERFDPWPEAVVIDTSGSPSATIKEASAFVS
jgi:predicted kinase